MRPKFSLRDVPIETFSDQICPVDINATDTSHPDRRLFLTRLRDVVCTATLFSASDINAAETEKQEYQLLFDGKDDCVLIPSLRYPGRQPITLEARVTPSSVDGERTIVGNYHNGGLALRLRDDYWECIVHNNNQYLRARSDEQAVKDQAVHIAGMCDGRTVRLYIDQKPQKMYSVWSGSHRASQLPFLVGADPDGGGLPQHPFAGSIEALRISSIARDAMPTWKQHPFGKSDDFDAVYWDFTQKDGETIKDLSRWKHDGVIRGAKWETVQHANNEQSQ